MAAAGGALYAEQLQLEAHDPAAARGPRARTSHKEVHMQVMAQQSSPRPVFMFFCLYRPVSRFCLLLLVQCALPALCQLLCCYRVSNGVLRGSEE